MNVIVNWFHGIFSSDSKFMTFSQCETPCFNVSLMHNGNSTVLDLYAYFPVGKMNLFRILFGFFFFSFFRFFNLFFKFQIVILFSRNFLTFRKRPDKLFKIQLNWARYVVPSDLEEVASAAFTILQWPLDIWHTGSWGIWYAFVPWFRNF